MKAILLIIIFFCNIKAQSQTEFKLKEIDSLVTVIRAVDLYVTHDSTIQDYPKLGLNMKTYLTVRMNGRELKEYTQKVNTTEVENGVSKQLITSTSFYYDHNKLIKVEEFGLKEDKEMHADWYFSNDKPLYHTMQSEKSEERAKLLLTISESMQKKVSEQNNWK